MFNERQVRAGLKYILSFRPCDGELVPPMELVTCAVQMFNYILAGDKIRQWRQEHGGGQPLRDPSYWAFVGGRLNLLCVELGYPQIVFDEPQLRRIV